MAEGSRPCIEVLVGEAEELRLGRLEGIEKRRRNRTEMRLRRIESRDLWSR